MTLFKQLLITFSLLLFSCNMLHAQEENVWVFGSNTGLDFNLGSPPTPFHTAMKGFGESNASVCNSSGQLLFYTEGDTLWDRNGNYMPNGRGLTGFLPIPGGSSATSSSAQGSIIVPFPGDTSRYYVFSLTSMETWLLNETGGRLYYSVVDMNLNGGMGDVVSGQKGIFVDSGFTEQMTGVVGDDCNVWLVLVTSKLFMLTGTTEFKAYEINANGINLTPVVSNVGSMPGYMMIGYKIVSSPNRKKLALSYMGFSFAPNGPGSLELFDFDPSTAEVSNQLILDPNYDGRYYGICFSPNNQKLYVNKTRGYAMPDAGILQYDISSNNVTSIINSMTIIDSFPYKIGDIKLGPDGKVYYLTYDLYKIGSIDFPNLTGMASQVNKNAISLPDFNSPGKPPLSYHAGLPNVVPIIKPDTTYSKSDTVFCANQGDMILRSPLNDATYLWEDGSSQAIFTLSSPGTFWVKSFNYCHFRIDTFVVDVVDLSPVINVDEFKLSTTMPYNSYQWLLNGNIIQGATDSIYIVTENGDYTVIVTGESGCIDTSAIYKVTNVTAINSIDVIAHQIKIYPNPSKDIIYINAPISVNVKVVGIEGKLIKEALNVTEISIRDLAEGVYLLQLTDKYGVLLKTEKIIKRK